MTDERFNNDPQISDKVLDSRLEKLEYEKELVSAVDGQHFLLKKIRNEHDYKLFLGRTSSEEEIFHIDDVRASDGWLYVEYIGPGMSGVSDKEVLSASPRFWRATHRFTRQGVGTLLYDALEEDARNIGAKGIRPSFGWMSSYAIGFWKKRLLKRFPNLTDQFLEELLNIPREKDIARLAHEERVKKSQKMFEQLMLSQREQ